MLPSHGILFLLKIFQTKKTKRASFRDQAREKLKSQKAIKYVRVVGQERQEKDVMGDVAEGRGPSPLLYKPASHQPLTASWIITSELHQPK